MGADDVDRRELEAALASCVRSHAALVVWLRALDAVEPGRPSLLPGWTIGHVLTHIARNADSHRTMLDGRPQYPSVAARDDAIERGAGRHWSDLVDDVSSSVDALDERWAIETDWAGTATMSSGSRPRHLLPLLRQREVEVHRVDLGLDYRFDDLPGDYVRRDLRVLEMLWRARRPMGLTPLPDTALLLPPPTRLAWLLGRVEVDGLAPAGLL